MKTFVEILVGCIGQIINPKETVVFNNTEYNTEVKGNVYGGIGNDTSSNTKELLYVVLCLCFFLALVVVVLVLR